MKKIILIILVLVFLLGAILYIKGFSIPFCSGEYWTRSSFRTSMDINPQRFAEIFRSEGWTVAGPRNENDGQNLDYLVIAKKQPSVFFSNPEVTVKLGAYNRSTIDIVIYKGNRIANKILFDSFAKKMKDNFNINSKDL